LGGPQKEQPLWNVKQKKLLFHLGNMREENTSQCHGLCFHLGISKNENENKNNEGGFKFQNTITTTATTTTNNQPNLIRLFGTQTNPKVPIVFSICFQMAKF